MSGPREYFITEQERSKQGYITNKIKKKKLKAT